MATDASNRSSSQECRPLAPLNAWLARPVPIDSIVAFRIMFGLLMTAAMLRFIAKGWVRELYTAPAFHFTYPGFEWIHPWSAPFMYVQFVMLALLGLAIAAGCFYRFSTILFFLGFTYVELMEQTAYLNHYYLISLLSGLLILLPANRAWSVDALRKPQIRAEIVPGWCLNILRFQVALIYVFAGLAKFNADWLVHAQPLRIWLAARADLPLLGHWLGQVWVAYVASWFGALLDTGIVFFLLWKRTRIPAYLLLVFFHVATWLLFNIGMFPWIMIVAATLLFPADWPKRCVARLIVLRNQPSGEARTFLSVATPTPSSVSAYQKPNWLLRTALGLYAAIQLLLPLRPYFSSQPAAWTCSGFNCAWQVMIAEKTGYVEFFALDPVTGRRRRLSVKDEITPRQEMMMAQDPYLIRQMALHLAKTLNASGIRSFEIRTEAFATLNGRPSQRLIDPEANLSKEPVSAWIIPIAPSNETGSKRIDRDWFARQ